MLYGSGYGGRSAAGNHNHYAVRRLHVEELPKTGGGRPHTKYKDPTRTSRIKERQRVAKLMGVT